MSQSGKTGFGQNDDKSCSRSLICLSYFHLVHITVLNVSLALTAKYLQSILIIKPVRENLVTIVFLRINTVLSPLLQCLCFPHLTDAALRSLLPIVVSNNMTKDLN